MISFLFQYFSPSTNISIGNIYNYAFAECYSLEKVTIEEGVYQISSNAFNSCGSLATIVIPASTTTISSSAIPATAILIVAEGSYAQSFAEDNGYMYIISNADSAIEIVTVDGISYFIYNGEAIAFKFDGVATEVTVPAYIGDAPVVEIRGTFDGAKSLEEEDFADVVLDEE